MWYVIGNESCKIYGRFRLYRQAVEEAYGLRCSGLEVHIVGPLAASTEM